MTAVDFTVIRDAWVVRHCFRLEDFADCLDWAALQRRKDAIVAEVRVEHRRSFEAALRRIGK